MERKKRILILGGGAAAENVVREAKKMGLYVIATDYLQGGIAKELADKSYQVSTTDMEGLKEIVEREQIDGVFCGPSEFNIENVMTLCEKTGLPFYATREQWELCNNKLAFKDLCRKFNVPCVAEYGKEDKNISFPVIVKPVDGNSSRGITVCNEYSELEDAYKNALNSSNSHKAIIEKYIDNVGVGFNVRYVSNNEELYMVLTGDTYTVDPYERTALINAVGIYPSKYTEHYIKEIDPQVKKMFKSIGINHSSLFMQALVDDEIIFHEMGLRLSGGLLYKLVAPITDVNDMKMLLRYSVGEEFATREEIEQIDPYLKGKKACIFNVPLKAGKVSKIQGLDSIKENVNLQAYEEYYKVGDYVEERYIGTIQQHLGRFKFIVNSLEEVAEVINYIQTTLRIEDENGNDMIYRYFDTNRLFEC